MYERVFSLLFSFIINVAWEFCIKIFEMRGLDNIEKVNGNYEKKYFRSWDFVVL